MMLNIIGDQKKKQPKKPQQISIYLQEVHGLVGKTRQTSMQITTTQLLVLFGFQTDKIESVPCVFSAKETA